MPIVYMGPVCARRGCRRPQWKGVLCHDCWRLAHMFHRDPELFAFEPLDGWYGERDAVEVPWERVNALLAAPPSPAEPPPADPPPPERP